MKRFVFAAIFGFLSVVASTSFALTLTNFPNADAFVRAGAAGSNYGGAGNLAVSGLAATNALGQQNGLFDSLMRFSMGSAVSNFDNTFGAGSWALSGVTLKVTEVAAPMNNLFNRGVGNFEIRWIVNDVWTEGTGQPNAPTTDGVTYNDLPSILTGGSDVSLGTFSNAGQNTQLSFILPLSNNDFLNDLLSGGQVDFYLTAASSSIGFTFNSRSFGTVSGRPFLEVTANAVPEPGVCLISLLGLTILVVNRGRCNHGVRTR